MSNFYDRLKRNFKAQAPNRNLCVLKWLWKNFTLQLTSAHWHYFLVILWFSCSSCLSQLSDVLGAVCVRESGHMHQASICIQCLKCCLLKSLWEEFLSSVNQWIENEQAGMFIHLRRILGKWSDTFHLRTDCYIWVEILLKFTQMNILFYDLSAV